MKVDRQDLNKCGIYCIINTRDGKVYIGKSKNIYNRILQHKQCLQHKSKHENCHLTNAWYKYGDESFVYCVLEYLDVNEDLLRERELYWMQKFNSTDRRCGYNLRMDSSTNMIVHEETRKRLSESNSGEKNPNYNNKWSEEMKQYMSDLKKQQYRDGIVTVNMDAIRKGIANRKQKFIDHPESLQHMKQLLKEKNTRYQIFQYDKQTMELVKIWDYIADIIRENPNYKRHNIYAVCSGEKPSMYGYVWVKVLKDDIVQQ